MEKLTIVKIGGNIIDSPELLKSFLTDFSNLAGPKMLIHGGGKLATELSGKLGLIPKMIDGRRVTDSETLDVVCMVYAGLINKRLVAALQAQNCPTIGLTGADGRSLLAEKRPSRPIDYGFAGDVKMVNVPFFQNLLNHKLTPVCSPITADANGQLLNTNADTIASEIAKALSGKYEVHLIYCFEKKGVLADVLDENSVIPKIDPNFYSLLKLDGKVHSGMIPKLDNAFESLKKGVSRVIITGNLQSTGTVIEL